VTALLRVWITDRTLARVAHRRRDCVALVGRPGHVGAPLEVNASPVHELAVVRFRGLRRERTVAMCRRCW
jgi:hypothetical protein